MKRIGVSPRIINNQSYQELRIALDIEWIKFLKESQYIPVILYPHFSAKEIINLFNLDGILLTGGNDVDGDKEEDRLRDSFEMELIEASITNNIPVLGICRGMQILNKYMGGNLKEVTGHVRERHSFICEFKRLKLAQTISVNSFHRYGLDAVGSGFDISAIDSTTGEIEAIEHQNYKLWGIMWHPERETAFHYFDVNLFQKIFGELK